MDAAATSRLVIASWLWGSKYSLGHVEKLRAGVARHLCIPHRFVVVTDREAPGFERIEIDRPDLLKVRDGCYARLRMFDPEWRRQNDIGTLLCLDLDTVIVGPLEEIVRRPEPFVILHGGHFNPCKFNGSVMLIRDGAPRGVWDDFDPEEADRVATADGTWRGSDQTWIAHRAPTAAGFKAGKDSGIWAFAKQDWPVDNSLPSGARIVTFPGKRDPSQLVHLNWVKEHWSV